MYAGKDLERQACGYTIPNASRNSIIKSLESIRNNQTGGNRLNIHLKTSKLYKNLNGMTKNSKLLTIALSKIIGIMEWPSATTVPESSSFNNSTSTEKIASLSMAS